MKSLKEYLTEDAKEYSYRIKIAGELGDGFQERIRSCLEKYDPVDITGPKTTPIQKSPAGFPGITNAEINIIDSTLRYPASLDELKQQIHLLGVPLAQIVVLNSRWDDSITLEADRQQEQLDISEKDSLLNTEDLGKPTAEQLVAGKDYGASFQELAQLSANKQGFEVAGGTTPRAKTTNDLPQGTDSPLSKVGANRPLNPRQFGSNNIKPGIKGNIK